jgi:arylformamidase
MSDIVSIQSSMGASRTYTLQRLELEFSPAKWHWDREATLRHHAASGAHLVKRLRPHLDVRYGDGPLQSLDVFPASRPNAPCCILIHGGFWRISDKSAMHFAVQHFNDSGAACFVINFDLCPHISVDRISAQVMEALIWISKHAGGYGASGDRLFLLGHATGAHLAAMAISTDRDSPPHPIVEHIRGALLLSGLYNLTAIPKLDVNWILGLDDRTAAAQSPVLRIWPKHARLIIAAATQETAEFIAQSKEVCDVARSHGSAVDDLLVADHGHFTILDILAERGHPITSRFIDMMQV